MRDDRRGLHLRDVDERAHRRLAAGKARARRGTGARQRNRRNVQLLQRGDAVAVRRIGLNVDAPRTIEVVEIVDVVVTVDVELDLRRVQAKLREDSGEPRILIGRRDDPPRGVRKRRQTDVALVLEFELEAAEASDAVDRRRIEADDRTARDLRELAVPPEEQRVE